MLASLVTCNVGLDSESDLKTHMESHEAGPIARGSNPNNIIISNLTQPPVEPKSAMNVQQNNSRQYNRHQCPFQGNSSKNLTRHFKVTGHKTDMLSEKCYTCDKTCENFDDLMIHRKEAHPFAIGMCRYFQENKYCKFENKCYYSHTYEQSSLKQVFQKNKEPSPPDQSMTELFVMLKDLMTTYIQVKGEQSERGRNTGN